MYNVINSIKRLASGHVTGNFSSATGENGDSIGPSVSDPNCREKERGGGRTEEARKSECERRGSNILRGTERQVEGGG